MKQVNYKSGTIKIQEFQDISSLLNYLDKAPLGKNFKGKYSFLSSRKYDYNEWSGTSTYEEARNLLLKGWTPAAEKLTKRVPVSTVPSTVKNSRPAYSTVGHQASVPRYLQGIPTNMIDRKPQVQKQKIIILNKSMSYSAMWGQARIEEQGIKALQVIQALESRGYRVKMNMVFSTADASESQSRDFKESIVLKVTIKKPDERFSLSKMAFPLVHTAMLRRIGFDWVEKNQDIEGYSSTWSSFYGYPSEVSLKTILNKNEYLLPSNIADVEEYVKSLGL
jgi:hypothetical protein